MRSMSRERVPSLQLPVGLFLSQERQEIRGGSPVFQRASSAAGIPTSPKSPGRSRPGGSPNGFLRLSPQAPPQRSSPTKAVSRLLSARSAPNVKHAETLSDRVSPFKAHLPFRRGTSATTPVAQGWPFAKSCLAASSPKLNGCSPPRTASSKAATSVPSGTRTLSSNASASPHDENEDPVGPCVKVASQHPLRHLAGSQVGSPLTQSLSVLPVGTAAANSVDQSKATSPRDAARRTLESALEEAATPVLGSKSARQIQIGVVPRPLPLRASSMPKSPETNAASGKWEHPSVLNLKEKVRERLRTMQSSSSAEVPGASQPREFPVFASSGDAGSRQRSKSPGCAASLHCSPRIDGEAGRAADSRNALPAYTSSAPQWVRIRGCLDSPSDKGSPATAISSTSPQSQMVTHSPADQVQEDTSTFIVPSSPSGPSTLLYGSAPEIVQTPIPLAWARNNQSEQNEAAKIPPALRLGAVDAIRQALEGADKLNDDLRLRLLGLLDDLRTPVSPGGIPQTIVGVEINPQRKKESKPEASVNVEFGDSTPTERLQACYTSAAEALTRESPRELPLQAQVPSPLTPSPVAKKPRQGTLSLARDQFKTRIRALERSDEFHSALLRELDIVKDWVHV